MKKNIGDVVLVATIIPVIIQAGIMVFITCYGFDYLLLKHFL